MENLSNSLIKSLLGLLLLCVFTARPCTALVRNVSALKNLTAIEKGIEESSKENKETKESKSSAFPDYELPAMATGRQVMPGDGNPRPRILSEVQGCPGPILGILTPPPDAVLRF